MTHGQPGTTSLQGAHCNASCVIGIEHHGDRAHAVVRPPPQAGDCKLCARRTLAGNCSLRPQFRSLVCGASSPHRVLITAIVCILRGPPNGANADLGFAEFAAACAGGAASCAGWGARCALCICPGWSRQGQLLCVTPNTQAYMHNRTLWQSQHLKPAGSTQPCGAGPIYQRQICCNGRAPCGTAFPLFYLGWFPSAWHSQRSVYVSRLCASGLTDRSPMQKRYPAAPHQSPSLYLLAAGKATHELLCRSCMATSMIQRTRRLNAAYPTCG